MAIYQVVCPNQHPLRVTEAHFGKTVQCPTCQATFVVPPPVQAAIPVLEAAPAVAAPPSAPPPPFAPAAVSAAPPISARRAGPSHGSRVVLVVGLIALVGIGAWLAWSFLLGGAGQFRTFIPDDAEMVSIMNLDAIRSTDFYRDFKDKARDDEDKDLRIKPDDVASLCMIGLRGGSEVMVFRTVKDMPMEDFARMSNRDVTKFKGMEYGKTQTGKTVCKTSSRTFCLTSSESKMEDVIVRLGKGGDKLDADMDKALSQRSGAHVCMIAVPRSDKEMRDKAGIRVIGMGANIGSDIRVDGEILFDSPEKAKDWKDRFDKSLDDAQKAVDAAQAAKKEGDAPSSDSTAEKQLKVLKAMTAEASGNALRLSATFDYRMMKDAGMGADPTKMILRGFIP